MSMEVRQVTTSVQCSVSGGDGHLSAEVDSRAWGLNGGRSQYFPGDTCNVLVYMSQNVYIVGSHVLGAKNPNTTFKHTMGGDGVRTLPGDGASPVAPVYDTALIGYNIVRENIQFNNPVSQISKPPVKIPTLLHQQFKNCDEPKFYLQTTIVRLMKWTATTDPQKVPPHGSMFVEYTPSAQVFKFENLGIPAGIKMFTYPNTAYLYAVAIPMSTLGGGVVANSTAQ